jgi:hypothetical protein
MMRKPKPYRFIHLPPDFSPKNATFDEACSYARHSRWMGHQKVREGRWRVFKDGRKTIVEFASVLEDEERLKAKTGAKPPEPKPKRPPGRPKTKVGAEPTGGAAR